MFIGGNLFNFSTITHTKKIKKSYILYIFLKKKNFLLLNFLINTLNVVEIFLFVFFFGKTKSILCITHNGSSNTNNFKNFFFKNFIKTKTVYSKILNKYTKVFVVNIFSKYLFLQNIKNKNVKIQKNNKMCVLPQNTSSSIYKYINIFDSNNVEFQFLRKNKVYNKGRYSRCRQNYRTGVYLCMYLSVASIFGLYYWFFKFNFNFSYLWWFFIVFLGSFLFPKIIKYRLYEPSILISSFYNFFLWVSILLKSLKG